VSVRRDVPAAAAGRHLDDVTTRDSVSSRRALVQPAPVHLPSETVAGLRLLAAVVAIVAVLGCSDGSLQKPPAQSPTPRSTLKMDGAPGLRGALGASRTGVLILTHGVRDCAEGPAQAMISRPRSPYLPFRRRTDRLGRTISRTPRTLPRLRLVRADGSVWIPDRPARGLPDTLTRRSRALASARERRCPRELVRLQHHGAGPDRSVRRRLATVNPRRPSSSSPTEQRISTASRPKLNDAACRGRRSRSHSPPPTQLIEADLVAVQRPRDRRAAGRIRRARGPDPEDDLRRPSTRRFSPHADFSPAARSLDGRAGLLPRPTSAMRAARGCWRASAARSPRPKHRSTLPDAPGRRHAAPPGRRCSTVSGQRRARPDLARDPLVKVPPRSGSRPFTAGA
jgi:hypothetical protein